MYINRCCDNSEMNKNMPSEATMMNKDMMSGNCMCSPIMECPEERVCHREICYDVPQVSPFM